MSKLAHNVSANTFSFFLRKRLYNIKRIRSFFVVLLKSKAIQMDGILGSDETTKTKTLDKHASLIIRSKIYHF